MAKHINNDPQGALTIDGVGLVAAGGTFEVTGEAADYFASLPDLFPRVGKKKSSDEDVVLEKTVTDTTSVTDEGDSK